MTLVASRTLDLNADVAEWCPIIDRQHLLAVGTYELQEELGERVGRWDHTAQAPSSSSELAA
jgi:hypothetical protein